MEAIIQYICPKQQAGIDVGVFDEVKRDSVEDVGTKVTGMLQYGEPCLVRETKEWTDV